MQRKQNKHKWFEYFELSGERLNYALDQRVANNKQELPSQCMNPDSRNLGSSPDKRITQHNVQLQIRCDLIEHIIDVTCKYLINFSSFMESGINRDVLKNSNVHNKKY